MLLSKEMMGSTGNSHSPLIGYLKYMIFLLKRVQMFYFCTGVRFEGEKIRTVAGQVSGVQGSSSWSSHGYLLQKILVFS